MGDTDKKSSWQLYLNLVREKHLYLGKNVLLDFFILFLFGHDCHYYNEI